jgi:uncharacterized protein YjbI with pentapeptide repeats
MIHGKNNELRNQARSIFIVFALLWMFSDITYAMIESDESFHKQLSTNSPIRITYKESSGGPSSSSFTSPYDNRITADEILNKIKNNESIELNKMRILGDLILTDRIINSSIRISNSIYYGKINFNNSKFSQDVILNNSCFLDDCDFSSSKFSFASFEGLDYFGSAKFKNSVFNLGFFENSSFLSVDFSNSILYYAYFANSSFNRANFSNCRFGPADFSNTKFGSVNLNQSAFLSEAYFNNSVFAESANFNDVLFSKLVSFKNAKFNSDASFARTVFYFAPDFSGSSNENIWKPQVSTKQPIVAHETPLNERVNMDPYIDSWEIILNNWPMIVGFLLSFIYFIIKGKIKKDPYVEIIQEKKSEEKCGDRKKEIK